MNVLHYCERGCGCRRSRGDSVTLPFLVKAVKAEQGLSSLILGLGILSLYLLSSSLVYSSLLSTQTLRICPKVAGRNVSLAYSLSRSTMLLPKQKGSLNFSEFELGQYTSYA